MLQAIRDKSTGWIVWFIVGLIVVPFAFWGIESFRTGGGDPVIAKVGGQEITQSQFRAGYEQKYQQFQMMMGERFRADQFDQTRFRQAVLDDMTQESMLRQFVHHAGYRASDAALFTYLSKIPAFQQDGKFSKEAYLAALSRQGMKPEQFESQLRDSLEMEQMREAVLQTAFVTPADAALSYRLANEERDLAYAVFDYSQYVGPIEPTDAEIKSRYETDKSKFMAPERIKLAYVELSADSLNKAAPPPADVLQVIYNAEKESRFTTAEERKGRHILISFGTDKAASKTKIEKLAEQIKNGGNFAELAKADSDDTGSKSQGGELGWVKHGQMVEKFEKALFSLKPGETSSPVETEFGWHLIQVEDIKPAKIRPFEETAVQAELSDIYLNRERQKRFQEQTEKLEQLAFENPASLDAVVKALGVTVQTTDWFTRAGGANGLTANDAIKQAAFSKEVAMDGDNSKPITIAPGKVVVIRKAEYEAPRQKPLNEVMDAVRSALKDEGAKTKAQAEATQMSAAVRAGQSASALAAARGVTLKNPGYIKRDNNTEDRSIVEALFRLPRTKTGDATAQTIRLANGNVAVVVLSGVRDAETAATADAALQQRQRDALAGAEFGAYRKAIEKSITIKIVNPPAADVAPTPES
jgi:peptidyl-prolyl cis-trans isomerase D